ncbi:MAG: carbohydrate ABC transporter permease [Actinomycetaceae bacterium]|nr:carbohydrate ABC transporter permease [Actinomycetaceae bacterium]
MTKADSSRATRRALREAPQYIFLTVVSVISVFPLYFMAVSATNTTQDVLGSRMLPGGNLLANYESLVSKQDLMSALGYSALTAVGTTLLALAVCSIAGYGFEIYHSKSKDALMNILLLAMMIPFAATMIPLFRLFASLGLVNSLWALVLPTIATPFLILLFRQASRSFPHEVIEAARIDGLSEVAIFLRIFLPTMRSTYAAAAVITFMAAWNNFLWPRVILIDNDFQTLPLLISNFAGGYVVDYGALMLAVLIASLPAVIVFLALQNAFANGITGAIK